MEYTLRIEGEGEPIVLSSQSQRAISKVEFVISQEDLATADRSENLFNSIVVSGLILAENQTVTKDLLNWSLKTNRAEIYKTVSLTIKKDNDVIRDYYLKNMFCTRYEECFDESQKETSMLGSFILSMRQRRGFIDTIKVDC